jgi:hypothetical protein
LVEAGAEASEGTAVGASVGTKDVALRIHITTAATATAATAALSGCNRSGGQVRRSLVEQVRFLKGWIRNERTIISLGVSPFWSLWLPLLVGTADAARGTRRAVKNLMNNIVVKGVER